MKKIDQDKTLSSGDIPDLEKAKHFCILPWVHARIETNGGVSPCCRIINFRYGSLKEQPFQEIWNGKKARDMRRAILRDEVLPQCKNCHMSEGPNLPPSHRQLYNEHYKNDFARVRETKSDGSLDHSKVLFLDLRFSNLCNFKCRICSPIASTAWYADDRAMNPNSTWKEMARPTHTREELWAFLDSQIPHLDQIYFAGGEPLLEEDHYILLEKLIQLGRTDIILSYNTNLSRLGMKNWSVLDMWPKFKRVHVAVSMDGVGPHAELLRKGTRWPEIEKNFELIKALLPEEHVMIFPTISAMNAFHIPVAVKHFLSMGWIILPRDIRFNMLDRDEYLHIGILNFSERERLKKLYADFCEEVENMVSPELADHIKGLFQLAMDYIPPEVKTMERMQFRQFSKKLDVLRGENFISLFPEFKDLYEEKDDPSITVSPSSVPSQPDLVPPQHYL